MGVILDQSLCVRCGSCVRLCNMSVFAPAEDGSITVNDEKCFHCGHCYAVCPTRAITLDGYTPNELPLYTKPGLSPAQEDMLFKGCRSVRAYKQEPVSQAHLDRAFDLATYAPTARNVREVHWTVINGREKLQLLVNDVANVVRNTDSPYARMVEAVDRGLDPVLRGAPCLIMAHAEPWVWAEADCSIAVSWLELALHSLGIGTCWCGILISAAKQTPLPHLPLPPNHVAYAGLMVGYPTIPFKALPPRSKAIVQYL